MPLAGELRSRGPMRQQYTKMYMLSRHILNSCPQVNDEVGLRFDLPTLGLPTDGLRLEPRR